MFCFSLDRTGERNSVGRSLAQQKLRAKLCKESRECTEARNKRQREVGILETLKGTIDDFDLGAHFEIELIGGYTVFLTFSATPEKNYSKNIGSYHPVKLLISPSGSYEVRVNIFDCVGRGNVDLQDYAYLKELAHKISSKSPYKICPRLTKVAKYDDLKAKLGYEPKNVFSTSWPWKISRHSSCSLWHIPNNSRLPNAQIEDGLVDSCFNCKMLSHDLNKILARREERSEGPMFQRQSASSSHAFSFLSPVSKQERLRNIRNERKYYKQVAEKYWNRTKVALGDPESDEFCRLVNEIESKEGGRTELENIFEEAETTKEGRGLTLKELWKKEKLDFITDQWKNGNIFFCRREWDKVYHFNLF